MDVAFASRTVSSRLVAPGFHRPVEQDRGSLLKLREYRERIQFLNAEFNHLEESLQEKDQQLEQLRSQVETLARCKEDYRQAILQREQLLTEYNQDCEEIALAIRTLTQEQRAQFEEQKASFQDEIAAIQAETKTFKERCADLQRRVERADSEFRAVEKDQKQKLDRLKSKWDIMKQEMQTFTRANQQLKRGNQEAYREVQGLKADIAGGREELSSLKAEINDAVASDCQKNHEMLNILNNRADIRRELEQQICDTRLKLSDMDLTAKRLEDDNQKIRNRLKVERERNAFMAQQQDQLESKLLLNGTQSERLRQMLRREQLQRMTIAEALRVARQQQRILQMRIEQLQLQDESQRVAEGQASLRRQQLREKGGVEMRLIESAMLKSKAAISRMTGLTSSGSRHCQPQ